MNKREMRRRVYAEAAGLVRMMSDGADRPEDIHTDADEGRWLEVCEDVAKELERRGKSK